MAEELNLPFGPWSPLVSGTWGSYPFSIHHNPDRALLLVIYDKNAQGTNGMLVSLRQPIAVEGDLNKFILAQKREMVYLEKFVSGQRRSFLVVGTNPAYVPFALDALSEEVKRQFNEVVATARVARETAEGYGAHVRVLTLAGDDYVQALLGDPMSIFSLTKPMGPAHENAFPKSTIGLALDGREIKVKIESMSRVLVVGGEAAQRRRALHVLTEAALLGNTPVLLFDDEGAFEGLSGNTNQTSAFGQFGMTPLPVSFQFRSFELGKNLFIDLSLISVDQFLTAFSLANADVAPLFKKVYAQQTTFSSLEDLVTALTKLPETRESPQYLIHKAVRLSRLVQRVCAGMFGRSLVPELFRPWQDPYGRALHLNVKGLKPQIANLLLISLLQSIMPAPQKRTSALIVFSKSVGDLKPLDMMFKRFEGSGIGIAFQSGNELDATFVGQPSLRVQVLAGNEAVLEEAGEQRVRVNLRPTYSRSFEEVNGGSTLVVRAPAPDAAPSGMPGVPMSWQAAKPVSAPAPEPAAPQAPTTPSAATKPSAADVMKAFKPPV